jgi:hypothetical protein
MSEFNQEYMCTWIRPMRIEDAVWRPDVNLLIIRCGCGQTISHPANRWKVRCICGREENLHDIREAYVQENYKTDPKVVISAEATDKESGQTITAQYQIEPKDIERAYMDEIEKLVGNGQARVTVSADFGIKDFGTGASAMCSVSLTCNQDAKTIEKAAQIAGDMARDIAQEQRARAEQELLGVMSSRSGATSGPGPHYNR